MTEPSVVDPAASPGSPEAWARLTQRAGYWLAQAVRASGEGPDDLAARHLDDTELADLRSLPAPARDGRLLGRLAGKAAVRGWLAGGGAGMQALRDVRIRNDAAGRPRVEVAGGEPVQVSLAHCGNAAVATVLAAPAGIDLEVVEPRGSVFARLALTAAERRLGARVEPDADVWVTRAWTIKEAVAKAAGTGLRGRPKDIVIDEADDLWAYAAGRWVRSAREGDMVVSLVAPRPA